MFQWNINSKSRKIPSNSSTSSLVMRTAWLYGWSVAWSNLQISKQLLDGLSWCLVKTSTAPRKWILVTFVTPHTSFLLNLVWTFTVFAGDPLTFYLAPSSGENFNLSRTLIYEQIPAKLMSVQIKHSCTLCLWLIWKCQHARTLT